MTLHRSSDVIHIHIYIYIYIYMLDLTSIAIYNVSKCRCVCVYAYIRVWVSSITATVVVVCFWLMFDEKKYSPLHNIMKQPYGVISLLLSFTIDYNIYVFLWLVLLQSTGNYSEPVVKTRRSSAFYLSRTNLFCRNPSTPTMPGHRQRNVFSLCSLCSLSQYYYEVHALI
jgi:hypothetical protein